MRQPRHLFIFELSGKFKKSDGSDFSSSPCIICEHIGIQTSRNPLPEIPELPEVPKLGKNPTNREKANRKAIQERHDMIAGMIPQVKAERDRLSRKYQVGVMLKCFDGKSAYESNSNNVTPGFTLPSSVYVDSLNITSIKKELIKSIEDATGGKITKGE